ncbi:unnamed protein product [Blumeria hordei]|uniref:Uncharacterized protein n=1 Tax=Blumeria hordei TaxID=2867405 RepID=A0A383UPK7_BLUHO|nr:unnamed protein product [Blumeria hordei]
MLPVSIIKYGENDYEELPFIEKSTTDGTLVYAKSHNFWKAVIWIFCSTVAQYTLKLLLSTYRFPLTLAFRSYILILVVYVFILKYPNSLTGNILGPNCLLPSGKKWLTYQQWTILIPASLAAAISYPMLIQASLHTQSLPIISMLFPTVRAIESLTLIACRTKDRFRNLCTWEIFLSIGASVIVLDNDYRLNVLGLAWGVGGLLLAGLSRAWFIIGSERVEVQIDRSFYYHVFLSATLLFGLIFSGLTAFHLESPSFFQKYSFSSTVTTITFYFSIIVATFLGTAISFHAPLSLANSATYSPVVQTRLLDVSVSFASSLLILLVSSYFGPFFYVSPIQIMAYLFSLVLVTGVNTLHEQISTIIKKSINKTLNTCSMLSMDSTGINVYAVSTIIALKVMLLSWILSSINTWSLDSLSEGPLAKLDYNYRPKGRFDIVVSMYNEDPFSIASVIGEIKMTRMLKKITTRTIIYTKSPAQNTSSILLKAGADEVIILPNKGREGGTYLHHIVNNWDKLAEQTLFIQAHAHNSREIIPRINDYLVHETGMLSLGFVGQACLCGECGDRWGWQDDLSLMPEIYQLIYHQACTPNTKILLSYKGQFIASARRIRGINKNIYENLLRQVTGEHGDNFTMTEQKKEDWSNPTFGFSLERVWSLLLQCATDERIAIRCPSLLSGYTRGIGVKDDCQCLDWT